MPKDDVIYKEEGKGKPPIEKIDEGPTQPEERVQFNDKLEKTEEEADESDEMVPVKAGTFAYRMKERMNEALKEAKKAYNEGEVPIGAVISRGDRIIARAHNRKESLNDPTAHAEILAIREAARELGDWRLEGCELYVTAEPCPMCLGAIMQTRMKRLVYGTPEPEYGALDSHRVAKLYPSNLQIYGGATRKLVIQEIESVPVQNISSELRQAVSSEAR